MSRHAQRQTTRAASRAGARRARVGGPGTVLTEAQWQNRVVGLARFYDWLVYHPPDNLPATKTGRRQRVTPGYPDLTLVRDTDLIFAELKTAKGRVSPDQHVWITALEATSAETYVWRPADEDQVHDRLARGRNRIEPGW